MDSARELEKARLIKIEWTPNGTVRESGETIAVQFNPASLRLSYTNQVQTNDQSNKAGVQHVGKGSTKLSLELVFDVSMPLAQGATFSRDVRELTEKLACFVKPCPRQNAPKQVAPPPAVRFQWGSFMFDGVVESMEETLDLWSEDGRPLRAAVSLGLTEQGTDPQAERQGSSAAPGTGAGGLPAGATPMQAARAGDNVQRMAARMGKGSDWKQIASANGIENPRHVPTGTLINPQAR